MSAGKEEKKIEVKEEKKKENIEVITAIYNVNLHCQECGNKIKRHLMTIEGVHTVDIDIEKREIKAKGKIDPLKILKIIEKKSKKKVELISPKVKPKEIPPVDIKPKEIKEPIIRTITAKVHMHCDKCEADLKRRLIKHKGIFNVKTDKKAQILTVEGTIEVEKLKSFLRKRVHKNAEIISIKEEKKEEKKEKVKEEVKKEGKKEEVKEEVKKEEIKKEKVKEEVKSSETIKEKEGIKFGESTKIKENVPYIIHYVYAPQLFSDENPNSCSIL